MKKRKFKEGDMVRVKVLVNAQNIGIIEDV